MDKNKRHKGFKGDWVMKNLVLAVVIVVAIVLAVQWALAALTRHGESVTVPDFTNMTVSEAAAAASRSDVRVKVVDSTFVRRLEKGAVYRQVPKAGSAVKKGRHILLTVNSMVPKTVQMPNLVGYSLIEAKAELMNRGLNLSRLRYEEDIATNNVLRQLYRGRDIAPGSDIVSGSDIDLVLGLNPKNNATVVPKVTGLKYIRATDVLNDYSLNRGRAVFDREVRTYADSVNAVVYRQDPAASEQAVMGSGVRLYLTLDETKVPE